MDLEQDFVSKYFNWNSIVALIEYYTLNPPTPCLVQNGACFWHGGGVFCVAFVDMRSIFLV